MTIWKQTITGRAFPMTDFTAADIDLFGDCAEGLARVCRYGGHVPGNPFSVAQHCVIGADAALDETADANLAAHVLLHDAHEYIFGDMTTPVFNWLAHLAGDDGYLVRALVSEAKSKLDVAIWKAAGIPAPGATYRAAIADYDVRLLATEQRQLLMPAPKSWGSSVDAARPIRMKGRLTAWPVAKAADEFRDRLTRLCPNARRV